MLHFSGHLEFPTCIKQNHSKGKCNYHLTNVYSWVQFAKKNTKRSKFDILSLTRKTVSVTYYGYAFF